MKELKRSGVGQVAVRDNQDGSLIQAPSQQDRWDDDIGTSLEVGRGDLILKAKECHQDEPEIREGEGKRDVVDPTKEIVGSYTTVVSLNLW